MLHCRRIRLESKFRTESNGEVGAGRTFRWRMKQSELLFYRFVGALYHCFPFLSSTPQFSVEPEKETWMRSNSTSSQEMQYFD